MASISEEKKGGFRLLFNDPRLGNRKRSIWLGRIPRYSAEEIKEHVEHLLAVSKNNRPPCAATTEWLERIDSKLRDKLAKQRLCESMKQLNCRNIKLHDWTEEFIENRSDKKASTINTYRQAAKSLVMYFGKNKRLAEITECDAKNWRLWMKKSGNRRNNECSALGEDTVRRRSGIAKQMMREAIRVGYLKENPFECLPSNMRGNKERQFFVDAAVIEQCMDHCPSIEWQAILALARYGGLRIPSELVLLRWKDIDFRNGKFLIRSPKTEDHPNGESRWCPIFPELRLYLDRAKQHRGQGQETVINSYRSSTQNLRQAFLRILKKAGIKPWPKLFHNLRASRETELLHQFPTKDVCSWIGNSEKVAMKSYAMPTDQVFQAAASKTGSTVKNLSANESDNGEDYGSLFGSLRSISATISTDGTIEENADLPEKSKVLIVEDSTGEQYLLGRAGLEPATKGL